MRPKRPLTLQRKIRLYFFQIIGITLLLFLIWYAWVVYRGLSLSAVIVFLLVVAVAHLVLGNTLVRNVAKPLNRLNDLVNRLSCEPRQLLEPAPDDPQEIRQLITSINAVSEQMEHSMTELRNFVTNASHELRTPLTTVKLRVEALRDGAIDDRQVAEKFLNEMESEIDSLTKMVTDLLDLSRIEAGIAYSPVSEVDLTTIVREVCDAFHVRAERANISLTCNIEKELPPILGYEDQLRRMVYNLVDNALKYTNPSGWVEVSLKKETSAEKILLTVRDNGFGIHPSYLPHIFERFYRVEATRPRYGQSRGSGLGLAIVKAIADTHKAEIKVESEIGAGTSFIFSFPISACG